MKRTKSIGVNIALQFYPEGTMDHAIQAVKLSRLINAAIKRAVKEAIEPSIDASREYRLIERKRIAAKYGVKL